MEIFTTRLVEQGDAEAILAIYNAEVEDDITTFDLEPRTLDDQIRWIHEHKTIYPAIVALSSNNEVIGFGSLSRYKERKAYSTTVEDSVYVRKDLRNRKVGSLILTELMKLARSSGFHAIIARVSSENIGSIALHQSLGFEIVGQEKEVGRKFNRWLDVCILERLLSE